MNAIDIFNKIKATTKKLEKEAILRDNFNLVKDALSLCYNPFLNFNITCDGIKNGSIGDNEELPITEITILPTIQGRNAKIDAIEKMLKGRTVNCQIYSRAIIDKDLGIGLNVKTINKVSPGLIPEYPVMLAERENKEKYVLHYSNTDYVFVNLKIDGIRCVCDCTKDKPVFCTREGKPISDFLTENISREIVQNYSFFKGMILDGEIYSSDFRNLMRVFQHKYVDVESTMLRNKCKFAIFDIPSCKDILEKRVEILESIQETVFIKTIKYVKVKNEFGLIKQIAERYIDQGHEGIIAKHPNGVYEDKRSFFWMKFKKHDSIDLEIIGVEEGEGKYQGMLGALILDYEGKRLNCGTGFTDKDRVEMWSQRTQLVGKTAQISFMEKTKTDSLRHPVFECIRIDK